MLRQFARPAAAAAAAAARRSTAAAAAPRACAALSTEAREASWPTETRRPKHKVPRKLASKLMGELRAELVAASDGLPQVAPFKVGDAVEVKFAEGANNPRSATHKGVVLAITNRGADSSFLLREVTYGTPAEIRFPLHSPLLRSLEVIQEAFIHRGKKRVRRAKLYYLRGLDVNKCALWGVGITGGKAKGKKK